MFNTYKTITRIVFYRDEQGNISMTPGDRQLCRKYGVNAQDFAQDALSTVPMLVVLDVIKKPFGKSRVVTDYVLPLV